RIGDHCRHIAADRATVVRHLPVLVVRRSFEIPVRAAGNAGAGSADNDSDGTWLDPAGNHRRPGADQQSIAAGYPRYAGGCSARIIAVDIDAVAIAKAQPAEPAVEASLFGRG